MNGEFEMTTKRILLAATALLTAGTASAENTTVLYDGPGYWTTAHIARNSAGSQTCLMSGQWTFRNGAKGKVMFKWQSDNSNVFMHIYKSNWRFTEGAEVPLVFSLDAGSRAATGTTFNSADGSGMIEVEIIPSAVSNVLRDFAISDSMRITFKQGSEPPWNAQMKGSRAATDAFVNCATKVAGKAPGEGATSPVGPQATSPVGPQATSPVAPSTSPLQPAKSKDNGGI
jgi:hypothetical protein